MTETKNNNQGKLRKYEKGTKTRDNFDVLISEKKGDLVKEQGG